MGMYASVVFYWYVDYLVVYNYSLGDELKHIRSLSKIVII